MDAVAAPKDVVRRFLDHGRAADGDWDMDVILECFSEHYWSHTWQGDLATTGSRQGAFFGGFDFLERPSSDLIAENDLVVHRSTVKLRHTGVALGVPGTGRVVTCEHVEMWRVTDGKIVEHWGGLGAGSELHRALTAEV